MIDIIYYIKYYRDKVVIESWVKLKHYIKSDENIDLLQNSLLFLIFWYLITNFKLPNLLFISCFMIHWLHLDVSQSQWIII